MLPYGILSMDFGRAREGYQVRNVMLMCAVLALAVWVVAIATASPTDAASPALVAPAKAVAAGSLAQARKGQQPTFVKLYRKRIFRERVWFNGREGDLEKHAIFRNGTWYITLTDLMRHLGGTIIWGPNASFIEVHRKGVVVRVIPAKPKRKSAASAATVSATPGQTTVVWPVAIRLGNRTWVAVKPFAELFGATVTWNAEARRVDVTFAP